jgi:hypothetical protein
VPSYVEIIRKIQRRWWTLVERIWRRLISEGGFHHHLCAFNSSIGRKDPSLKFLTTYAARLGVPLLFVFRLCSTLTLYFTDHKKVSQCCQVFIVLSPRLYAVSTGELDKLYVPHIRVFTLITVSATAEYQTYSSKHSTVQFTRFEVHAQATQPNVHGKIRPGAFGTRPFILDWL